MKRAFPNEALVVEEETLEDRMEQLAEIEAELNRKYKAYKNSVKELKATRESLRNIIIAEVLAKKETVTVGNIRAEYQESVVIKKKKEKTDEQ